MTFTAKAIANYFLERGKREGVQITPMKLQKLVYYAHGWCLAIRDVPLIDEQVEAWQWGPVIRSLYREFKDFGNSPIDRLATSVMTRRVGGRFRLCQDVPRIEDKASPDELEFTRGLLDRVWDIYSGYTPVQLSHMTHVDGGPWHQVVSHYGGPLPKGTDIPQDLIKSHFTGLAQRK